MALLKRLFFLSLFFIDISLLNVYSKGDPCFLKETWSCLESKFKHLSPVNGAIAWESEFIRRLYENGDDKTATVKLVKLFFYLPIGTFDVTQKKDFSDVFDPERIGHLLAIIEELLQSRCSCLEFKKLLKEKLKEDPGIEVLRVKIRKLKNSPLGKLKKEDLEKSKYRKFDHDIENLRKELKYLDQEVKAKQAQLKKKIINARSFGGGKHGAIVFNDFIELITESLRECGNFYWEDKVRYVAKFMPLTTQVIFLAVLYRQAESKAYFSRYFSSLKEFLHNAFSEDILFDDAWIQDIFQKTSKQDVQSFLEKEVSQWFGGESVIGFDDWLKSNYEFLVFNELIAQYRHGKLPMFASHLQHTRYYEGNFSDCCETAIRNLCNIILYNLTYAYLSLDELPADASPLPAYKLFIKNIELSSLTAVDKAFVHQEWSLIASNIPGVAYRKAISLSDGLVSEASFDRPYIFYGQKSDDEDFSEKVIGGVSYVVVNPNKYRLCEMILDSQSLIVCLNYLLGLKLFDTVEVALNNPLFTRICFPILCERLGWRIVSVKGETNSLEDLYTLRTGKPTELFIQTKYEQIFSLYLTGGHAEVRASAVDFDSKEYREYFFNDILNKMSLQKTDDTAMYQGILMLYRKAITTLNDPIKICLTKPIAQGCVNYRYAFLHLFYFLYPRYTEQYMVDESTGTTNIIFFDESDFFEKMLNGYDDHIEFKNYRLLIASIIRKDIEKLKFREVSLFISEFIKKYSRSTWYSIVVTVFDSLPDDKKVALLVASLRDLDNLSSKYIEFLVNALKSFSDGIPVEEETVNYWIGQLKKYVKTKGIDIK